MTVAQLDRELGEHELTYWEAFFQREPTKVEQSWQQNASIWRELSRMRSGEDVPLRNVLPDDPWSDDGNT